MSIYWLWIAIAILFAIIEFCTVTFFGLWMAIAALFPAIATFLAPTISITTQLLIWASASLLCAFIWVKWVRSSRPETYLESSLIGQEGLLAEAIHPGQQGILLLTKPIQGRQEWPCRSNVALARQTRVKIIAIDKGNVVEVSSIN